jgi:uncharacterized protein
VYGRTYIPAHHDEEILMTSSTFLRVSGLLCVLATSAAAQTVDTVSEPRTPAKLALVRELMETANFRSQVVRTMRETSVRQGAAMPVPPGFWDLFIARAEKDVDTLLEPMIEDYTRFFTSAELRELIAFYKSPIGQRLVVVSPVLGANASVAGQRWGARVGMEIGTEMMQRDGASSSTKPAKPPTASGKKP